MSTKTENYQLHQWAAEDQFLRTDFNEDHAKIDAAIKAAYERAGTVESSLTNAINQKASTSALTALQGTVNNKADKSTVTALQTTVSGIQSQVPLKLELGAMGSYTGDGSYPRTITVGFKPKLVYIMVDNGLTCNGGSPYGGFFTEDLPIYQNRTTECTAITSTGFSLLAGQLNNTASNPPVYHYFCFR